jgi:hypothetical protein
MEVNGTTQNNDESNFSENQTLEPSDDQGSMMVSNGSQNISGDGDFSVSNSSSNVNNTLNSEQNVSNVLNESGSLDTDAMLIQSPKLLKNANITSTSSNAKGSTDATNNDNNSAIGGSFLKNLFEINGPAYQSINELLEKYPYLPYYLLFSLLTASTGRESVERMLEWTRSLQAKQVTITKEAVENKEYMTEVQLLKANEVEDSVEKMNARAGISPSGKESNIKSTLKLWEEIIVISLSTFMPLICISIYGAYQIYNAIKSLTCKLRGVEQDPARKTKMDEIFDLINPVNAFAEVVAIICELYGCDEETVQKIRMWSRIIFGIILAVAITIATWGAGLAVSAVILTSLISGSAAILQGVYTYFSLKKQEDVAKKRLNLETAIAYCEKLQKDLDIIASEIDMIVELFTAAMDKIRAEYDRISRMIKETSDVKNMMARNIGA